MTRVEPCSSSAALSPTATLVSQARSATTATATPTTAWPTTDTEPLLVPSPSLSPSPSPSLSPPQSPSSSVSPATRPHRTTHTAAANGVAFGRVAYALTWLGIYTLHCVCALYLIATGYMYATLPTTQISNMLILYQLTLDPSYCPTIARVHYVVASVHCYLIAKPLTLYLVSRLVPRVAKRRLDSIQSGLSHRLRSSVSLTGSARTASALVITTHSTLSWLLRRVYRTLLARDGIFGVHNQHFELLFLFREVVETALQSYQGYNMSRLLPHMRLNRFYTCMLIVNCFTTPLLRKVFSKNRSLQRLLVVLCDIVLDFVSSIGVPVVVAASYIVQYDPESQNFAPWTVWYDDLWLLKFMNEAPLVLFGSWLDAISRLVFSISLLASMDDVKSLIRRRGTTAAPPRAPPSSAPPLLPAPLSSAIHPTPSSPPPAASSSQSPVKKKKPSVFVSSLQRGASFALLLRKPEHHAQFAKWVHRLLALWGIGIASVFLQAQLRGSAPHCSLELRPWLVSKPACAVVQIDCKMEPETSGTASQVDEIWQAIDAASVGHVIFRHCPKVEIPPRFRQFRNLNGFKTYNSTIVSWPQDAAFTALAHPRVRFAFLIMTQFPNGELPAGLLNPEFPQTLSDIEICGSNLRHVPDTLPWPLTSAIYIELSQLQVFPLVLSRLKPFTLSLAFNFIREFPAEAIMTPDIGDFTLRGNPIVELPEFGVDISQLRDTGTGINLKAISVERTNISTLPLWITERFLAQIDFRAGGSPICTEVLEQIDSVQRQELLSERPWLAQVNCEDPGFEPVYPLELDTGVSV